MGLIISTNGSILTKKKEYKQFNNMEMEKRIGYKDLDDLCKKLRLDPQKEGDNRLNKENLFIVNKPLVLETLFFTGENQTEVFAIGNRLRNLLTQTQSYPSYNYASKRGREEAETDSLIKKVVNVFEQLVLFYFYTEAKIDGYFFNDGVIYKINMDEDAVMIKAKDQIDELKKQFSSHEEQQLKGMG